MGILNLIRGIFIDDNNKVFSVLSNSGIGVEDYIYVLSTAHAIDLIARNISKTELQTYVYDKNKKSIIKQKGHIYYRLNVKPNLNDNSRNFLYNLSLKLLEEQEALVITEKTKNIPYLFLADSFNKDNYILKEKIFSNIVLTDNNGNTFNSKKIYKSSEVLYFSFYNQKLLNALKLYKEKSGKILNVIGKTYKHFNLPKYRLKNKGGQPTLIDIETNEKIDYNKYKEKITEGLFDEEQSVILLSEIFDLELLNKDKTKNINIEDYNNSVEKIGNKVAMTWNIPLDVFWGTKTEKSQGSNDFITNAVLPYFEVIEAVLNDKFVGEDSFIKGECIKFNRFVMNHNDITDIANSLDKLTAIGFSHNDLRDFLGLPYVNESWANEHNITKNYANVKGGENSEG